ncbi:hypothetical protein ACFOSC_01875 [Streptantibioticus rubrisoli]|uniref:Uncharacterized protein n=1 Tax=Streptantibioticus rubrisoli TaxID=1387313 RepID=A0ABT1PJG7_9ACTN|nr:hypothetical protein [Streptantibioticus rubrisoli]MCQ4045505.1 hypothetical protein [Streptantibioticus rubrisoli]
MSDAWPWAYDPDAEHVVGGLPEEVVAEVERLARQLAALGRDALEAGRGPRPGSLRLLDFFGGFGLLAFLPLERAEVIVITQVTWAG